MRIDDVHDALAVLRGFDLRLAFVADGVLFVPCARALALEIDGRRDARQRLGLAGCRYDASIEAWVMRDPE